MDWHKVSMKTNFRCLGTADNLFHPAFKHKPTAGWLHHPLALALPKASRPAIAAPGYFVCPRLRASSRATKQKSRPDFRLVGFVTLSGLFHDPLTSALPKNLRHPTEFLWIRVEYFQTGWERIRNGQFNLNNWFTTTNWIIQLFCSLIAICK